MDTLVVGIILLAGGLSALRDPKLIRRIIGDTAPRILGLPFGVGACIVGALLVGIGIWKLQ